MRQEAKVGIFVVIGIVLLFAMSTQIAQLSYGRQKGYNLHIELNNASGLSQYAKVRVNGVDAGFVSAIFLRDNKAYAILVMNDDIRIPTDSTAIVAQESMLGGKYIEIVPGKSAQMLADNEQITNFSALPTLDQTAAAIKDAADEFKKFLAQFQGLIDEEAKTNFKETLANIRQVSENLGAQLESLETSAHDMLASLQGAGDEFRQTALILNARLPGIADKLDSLLTNADELVVENKEPLKNTLHSVDSFYTEGRTVVQRLDNVLGAIDKSQIELGMRAEYLMRDSRSKGAFSVNYIPNPTYYYMGEVIGTDNYSRLDSNGEPILPKKGDKDKYYFSAQLGKRYGDWLFRAGIIESSAGGGIDYFALHNKLKMTLDIYDFGSKLDVRGTSPHVRAYLRYTLLRYIDAFVGWDNVMNSNLSGVYMGIGLRFIDNDVKPLIGTIGGAAK